MMTGIRKEKVPDACSETPAPVGEVELVELLRVPVAMVVALGLEVEFPPAVGSVLLLDTTSCVRHIKNKSTPI